MFSDAISKIISVIFPETCLFCKRGNDICCQACFKKIPLNISVKNNILSLYFFSVPEVNELIWQMKYHHTGSIAKLFAPVLSENLLRKFSLKTSQNIFLIPIPLNINDKRLHNHAELLANEIKKNLIGYNVNILKDLLIKNSKEKQSHTKNLSERLENMKGTFSLNTKIQFQNRDSDLYVLVDDVTTSGATINEARETLSKNLDINVSKTLAVTIAS